jgi:hypothetical protein
VNGDSVNNLRIALCPHLSVLFGYEPKKGSAGPVVGGDKVRSVVTPDDYATASDAQFAAQKLIRNL